MEIRLLSVPHSGTRSTMRILDAAGVEYLHQHFSNNTTNEIIHSRVSPAIIPIRDRDKVEESWLKRGKTSPGHNLSASWAEMEGFIENNRNVYLFRIDDPGQRDDDLQAISELLGVPLTADYSVKVGENGT